MTFALVSVVIPVRNGAEVLPAQLAAIAAQTYARPVEVVVSDNGSSDGSADVARTAGSVLDLRVVDSSDRRGVSHARNVGAAAASGDLLAFCDADDLVDEGWLAALAAAAVDVDIVGGRLDDSMNGPLARAWRGPIPQDALMRPLGFLPFAPGGNCAVRRSVFEALGGWDESYPAGSDDVDFSWRAQLAGHTVGFAAGAVLHYLYRASLSGLVRQFFTYGRSEALLYRRFRGQGVSRPPARPAVRRLLRLVVVAPRELRDAARRGAWAREVAYRLGRIAGSIEHRVPCP